MGLLDLLRGRLSFRSRGVIRITTPKASAVLETFKGAIYKIKDGWHLDTTIASGKILHQSQALLSLQDMSIKSSQHNDAKNGAPLNISLTSKLSFPSLLTPHKEAQGVVMLEALMESETTTITHYNATFSDISLSGQGRLNHTSPKVTGALDISLKGLDYNLILLFYTLSLRFGKTSELNSLLDQLAQKKLKQTEQFTLIIEPSHVYLREFPFIRFALPDTF